MIYHVQIDGKDAGAFSLEDLRRRRTAGLMTGQELVWCAGMPGWQTLDATLGIPAGFVPGKKRDPWVAAGIVAAAISVLCCVWFYVYAGRSLVHRFQTETRRISQAASRSASPSETAGVEVARRPIHQTTNSLTEMDVQKKRKAFRVRQYLDAYKKQGAHDQPWDADGNALIRSWIDSNFGDDETANRVKAAALGNKFAADSSCHDVIVLTVAAATSVEYFESGRRYERAVAAFANSPYKAYLRLFATAELTQRVKFKHPERIGPLDQSAAQLFKQCLSDGSVRAEDQPDILDSLVNEWGAAFFARQGPEVCQAAEQAGPSFQWLALMFRGVNEINLAWKARGDVYGDTVSPTGCDGFQDHLAKARSSLTEAWKVHPDWPQASVKMISVAMAESELDEARQWFDRATRAQVDYPEAWSNMRWTLRPRWLGSMEAIKDFGIMAVDSGRFDTDIPRKFFDCVSDLENDTTDLQADQHLYGRADIWPAMKRMYEGYIAERSQASYAEGWREAYAVVAYFAHHYDVSAEQLKKIDWQLPRGELEGWGTDASLLPLEVAARTSASGRDIDRAEKARDEDRIDEALRIYQKLAKSPQDERTQKFIKYRVASLEVEQRLQSGHWIDFLPTSTNDLSWNVARGHSVVLPDGAVEIHSGPLGSMLFSRVRIGMQFEIKGEFEVVSSTTKDFQAGLVMGMPELKNEDWYSFRMKRNANEGQIAIYAKGWTLSGTSKPVTLDDHRNLFDFGFRDGNADVSVNGKKIMIHAKFPAPIKVCDNQLLVGFGAYNDMNETVIRYSHVQLRRVGLGVALPDR